MHIHNFSPGPAALPVPVLTQMQAELTNWQNRGYSVLEVSHRSPQYMELVADTTDRLTRLLAIPDDYAVLYLTLSATAHFALVPINIATSNDSALYLHTGHWSKKASEHAATQLQIDSVQIDPDDPQLDRLSGIDPDRYAYAHFCPNETIEGIAWPQRPPLPKEIPLVGDFSSCLLSAPLRIRDYALIYASAQKNLGVAGISLIIIRKDLLGKARTNCPPACNYSLQEAQNSLLHTPNTFGIYAINLVCRWLEDSGGLAAMAQHNRYKAELMYAAITQNDLYTNQVMPDWQSMMNIPFQLADPALEQLFLQQAEQSGLLFLRGHKIVGGIRANLYNAVTVDSVKALVRHAKHFAVVR